MPSKVPTHLPRLDRTLPERVSFALALYRDGVIVPDIAAAAAMTHTHVAIAASAAGLPPRGREGLPGKRLETILKAASAMTDPEVQKTFAMSPAGTQAVRDLLADNVPRVQRPVVPPAPEVLNRRCPRCLRPAMTADPKSPCCGVPW